MSVSDGIDEMMAGKKRPAVIICPGGAYFNCSDREGEPIAMAFAAMGYHTFVLRYSTYGKDVVKWVNLADAWMKKRFSFAYHE